MQLYSVYERSGRTSLLISVSLVPFVTGRIKCNQCLPNKTPKLSFNTYTLLKMLIELVNRGSTNAYLVRPAY